MARRLWLLAVALFSIAPGGAVAESFSLPEVALEGSLPLYFGDNPAHELQRRSDYAVSPYFKLSAAGRFADDIWYSIYLSGGGDTYYSLHREDDTFAALTAHLSRRWDIYEFGVSYARVMYYGDFFGDPFNRGNDLGLFARIRYVDPTGRLRIQPYLSSSVRSDDSGSIQRTYFQFKLDIEQKLNDRWAFVMTPLFQVYDHFQAPASRDTVLSVTAGLKYKLNENIDLTPIVGYENRSSTLSLRNYTNRFFGASLDFSFVLLGSGNERTPTGGRYR